MGTDEQELVKKYNAGERGFGSAYLVRANLRGAALFEANLSGANLNEADLSGGDLRRACLDKAYLNGANLAGANLERVFLDGALSQSPTCALDSTRSCGIWMCANSSPPWASSGGYAAIRRWQSS
jgi:hypothetical protein